MDSANVRKGEGGILLASAPDGPPTEERMSSGFVVDSRSFCDGASVGNLHAMKNSLRSLLIKLQFLLENFFFNEFYRHFSSSFKEKAAQKIPI